MTTASPAATVVAPPSHGLTAGLALVFAIACGLVVANIYYAQPLVGPIAAQLGLHAGLAGLVMTLTQLGYGAGLLLVVPLADVIENRRLVVGAMGVLTLGLLGVAAAPSAGVFLAASALVGLSAVAAQVLVPFASHLAPELTRGRVVGNVMAGLLAGIMLARPFSSFVSGLLGWRAVFVISAVLMVVLAAVLWRALPDRRPGGGIGYGRMLGSLPRLVANTPVLRRRALYQGAMFAGFQAFWTAVPLLLAQAWSIGSDGIALFALAGAAGALAAPLAGRLADRGLTRPATSAALFASAVGFALAAAGVHWHSMAALVAAALVIDGAVQICQVLSLRALFALAPEARGRINGLFMAFVFVCGASGSGLAAALFAFHGWVAVSMFGGALALLALAYHLGAPRAPARSLAE